MGETRIPSPSNHYSHFLFICVYPVLLVIPRCPTVVIVVWSLNVDVNRSWIPVINVFVAMGVNMYVITESLQSMHAGEHSNCRAHNRRQRSP